MWRALIMAMVSATTAMLAPSSSNSIAASCADPANTIHEDAHPASVLTDSDSRMTTPSAIANGTAGTASGSAARTPVRYAARSNEWSATAQGY